jgi:hypothetical protein
MPKSPGLAIIFGEGKGKGKGKDKDPFPGDEEEIDGTDMAAESILTAIEEGDKAGFASALRAFVESVVAESSSYEEDEEDE